jgi:hypothetical protein
MHRLVQFHALDPRASPPDPGNLAPELLRVLCSTLGEHTKTPDACWFCLWEGYGWLHDSGARLVLKARDSHSVRGNTSEKFETLSPVLRDAVLNKHRVRLPNRDYLLFKGPLQAATEFGWFLTSKHFVSQSPNLFWPYDHAWCVASEIDLFCTLVAGSNELIDSLIADPRLEAWRVFADDPITADSDHVNT